MHLSTLSTLLKLALSDLCYPPIMKHCHRPIDSPTYDGSGQAVHPDVVRFDTPWRGYRYWMVMTPYPNMKEEYENPSILASDDGRSWCVPQGMSNPIVSPPRRGFHADPDVVYRRDLDELWLYYLETHRHHEHYLKLIRSADGQSWSEPAILEIIPYQAIRSPAVVYNGEKFLMWSVNVTGGTHPYIELRDSSDGQIWSAPAKVDLEQSGYLPSHLDVQYLPAIEEYAMILQACPRGGGPSRLFWACSSDGLRWSTFKRPLLSTIMAPAWARRTLYRASLTLGKTDGIVQIWYSGRSRKDENRIGYTEMQMTTLKQAIRVQEE